MRSEGATVVADASVTSMTFTTTSDGWMADGAYGLLETTDGGSTWTRDTLPSLQSTPSPTQVEFIDRAHGWALTAGAGVWGTSDGGRVWAPLSTVVAPTAALPA
jgi:photosystem II stability/assembly factor-like uncharacterized protein